MDKALSGEMENLGAIKRGAGGQVKAVAAA
jgi:hypothetical protein